MGWPRLEEGKGVTTAGEEVGGTDEEEWMEADGVKNADGDESVTWLVLREPLELPPFGQ